MDNCREYVVGSLEALKDWDRTALFEQLLRHLDFEIVCRVETKLDGRNLEYDERRYYLRKRPIYVSQYGDEQ